MKKMIVFATLLVCMQKASAQLLSWTPDFAKDNDNITITLDATKGNQGLNNYANPNDVYVHIGLITSVSANSGDWQHAPFIWGTTNALAKATSLGNNKYSYTISNIRSFFGAAAGETIFQIAILFRNGDGSVKQANTDGSDMYVPVYDNNLAVRFNSPFSQPTYTPVLESINKSVGDNIALTAVASQSSTMKLYLNGTVIQTATAATTISANPTLTAGGNTDIVAEADNGTTIKRDTVHLFVSGGANVAALPAGVRDGINYSSNNTEATLVLYAPGKNRVAVIGEFPGNNWTEQTNNELNKTPDGNYWWIKLTGLTAGTEYAFQYLVDGSLRIAEPYTEKVLDPANDQYITGSTYPNLKAYPAGQSGIVSILQTNATGYTWKVNNFSRPDKRGLVIYELLLRDFVAAHDWKTLKDTLPYLKNLGINAIEVMPFSEFEGNDSWGYNPDFYFAPDKYYGTKNSLKEFIDSCHSNGIAVIMDMVLNHSYEQSPLVQLYWDGANNRPAANNPWFNPVAKHAYNVGFDMNHESLATRYFVSRVMEHWLTEYKMDGFRFDLSKGFTQNQTCDNNGANCDETAFAAYDASRVAIWKRYYDTLQLKSPGCYAILEHFAVNDEEKVLSDYGMMPWGNMAYNYEQAAMGYNTDWDFSYGLFSSRSWNNPNLVTYMESHDEERLMYKNLQFGNSSGGYNVKDLATALKRIELNDALFLMQPGPKMIWQFGELGYDYSINTCSNGTVSNDCRVSAKPIRWDYLQVPQRKELHDLNSKLLQLRSHPLYKDIFTSATALQITADFAGAVKTLTLTTDTSKLVSVGNFDVVNQTATVNFPANGTWYDYTGTTTLTVTGFAQSITLLPGEYHVFINRDLNPVVTPPVNPPVDTINSVAVRMLPNPVGANSVVQVDITSAGSVYLELRNLSGRLMQVINNSTLSKGRHNFNFQRGDLPAGVYILKLAADNQTIATKIVIP